MTQESIKISRIHNKVSSEQNKGVYYTICFFFKPITKMEIDGYVHSKVIKNTAILMKPYQKWKIVNENNVLSGYVLYLPINIMENPIFSNLGITQALLDHTEITPTASLAPNIARRVYSILEMLDEFATFNMKYKDEAILSLLKTLFVYTNGTCNINYAITESNGKASLVQKFREVLDKKHTECHEVTGYASHLNVSEKYLNECVKEILNVNAKSLIDYILITHSQRELKFSDKSIKEISYDLGFSTPEYFSYFFKKHTGTTPTQIRKSR